jgi:hypothetical protein
LRYSNIVLQVILLTRIGSSAFQIESLSFAFTAYLSLASAFPTMIAIHPTTRHDDLERHLVQVLRGVSARAVSKERDHGSR